ncbi:NADH dehydrogenase (ubiquinone) B15 subunit [Arctopsyche grandis]|uniref:NADH dehydrogenase (ubiquinone) B15 subunit n=1 Tax=Arctopsyche grandis TaxID=121162 RepID=UPI00406D899B
MADGRGSSVHVSPMDPQYGLPKRQVELLREQAVLRAQRRHEFIKQTTNPYRFATNEGGYVFDPAIQRFLSTKACQYDYFKSSPKPSWYGVAVIMPFFALGIAVWKERRDKEHSFRTGQVAYRDRLFKFV